MNRVIWKYKLPVVDLHEFTAPTGLVWLDAEADGRNGSNLDRCLYAWAIANPNAGESTYRVHVVGTGNPIPDTTDNQYWVATVRDAMFVWHLFIREVSS